MLDIIFIIGLLTFRITYWDDKNKIAHLSDGRKISLEMFKDLSGRFFERYAPISGFGIMPDYFLKFYHRFMDGWGQQRVIENAKEEGYMEATVGKIFTRGTAIKLTTIFVAVIMIIIILVMLRNLGLLHI